MNGTLTYHLHLVARSDPAGHPLTDLYVDQDTYLLRAVNVRLKNEAYVSGYSGTMRLEFGRVGKFWLVTGGTMSASAHFLLAREKGSLMFAVSNASFAP